MSEAALDLKTLQSHLIKTIIGAVIAAVVTALSVGFSFYHKTTSAIEILTKEQSQTKVLVDKHTELLTQSSTFNSVSDVQIKALEKRMQAIELSQQEMLKLLIEINTSQKILEKKNNQ